MVIEVIELTSCFHSKATKCNRKYLFIIFFSYLAFSIIDFQSSNGLFRLSTAFSIIRT